ncbi:MAG: Gfo/Idh/MocA family oxidoreductase [Oscillospiraceae bacterium]|jgi:predicted dehydrogenase|nr:Gfo/Idh/MocA family oxidoreductase [Oscillospiraceae bacterium]
MKKLNVGIIGCGAIAGDKYYRALNAVPEANVIAFCSRNIKNAENLRDKFGATEGKVFTDYKEMLKDKSIDVVYVCTYNNTHAPITIAALKAGKHVMCEKPMATNYADAKKMCEAAKESGKLLTIGYQYRCNPAPLFLKNMCQNNELGEIYYAKAHAIRRRGVPTWGVFLDKEQQGGGPLIDIGTHALDMTLWMMDNYKPKLVVGSVYKKLSDHPNCGNIFGPWKAENYEVEDSAFAFITMENGATVTLEASWALNTIDTGEGICTLCGTKAGADMKNGLVIVSDKDGRFTELKPDFSDGAIEYAGGKIWKPEELETRNFFDAILYGAELRVKPEQALVVTQILDAIYESAATSKAVYIN